ncbi:MAG: ArnT family glycosyltransferase [Chthoniobacterales bacterium]
MHHSPSVPNERLSLGWRGWLLVISVSMTVCCFELGSARALTEHEIYVAGRAKQTALEGNWLFPKIGDQFWLEKPPLLDWLVIISAKVFGGFTETTVRLPSALAGVGVVVLMTSLALQWFGPRVALVTGLVQTTAVYFITYARLAEADMLLTLIVGSAIFVFVRLQSIGGSWPKPRGHLAVLFWGLVGLSNLGKGPGFGPLLILVPCVGFLIWQRNSTSWRRMVSWPGFALAIAVGISWPLVVALRIPAAKETWRVLIVERALNGAGFEQPWWYYLVTWTWQLLPWTIALLFVVGASVNRARQERDSPDRFIWCWAILPIALLSFSRGKHHHYVIASLCAFSPLIALGLLRCGPRVATACLVLAVSGCLYAHARVLPANDPARDDRDFLRSVRSLVPAGAPLAATGGTEIARHIFYVDPPPVGVQNSLDLADRFAHVSTFFVIARQSAEQQLTKLGHIDVVAQSLHTRKEKSPADRFTLFRIETGALANP